MKNQNLKSKSKSKNIYQGIFTSPIISIFVFLLFILIYSFNFSSFIYAGSLTSSKVTISDSRAGQSGTTHTFSFTTGTTGTIQTVVFEYCTTPSGTCTTPSGIVTTSAGQGSLTGLGASTTNFTTNGTFTLTVTSPVSVSSGTNIVVPYTTLTNPTTINSSFFVRITTKDGGGTTIDSTIVAFATLTTTSLAITADVGMTFSFAVAAVTTGSVNGKAINISSTTANTIPFGTLTSGNSKVAAHDLTVTTNAANGYVVTVKSSNPPLIDGSNNIDNFTEPNSLPLIWSSPAGVSPNVNTGLLGYTTEDSSLCTGTADRFTSSGGNKWAGFDTTPYETICNPSSTLSGETTRVGWQVEINGIQPSGTYTGDVILVATPTY